LGNNTFGPKQFSLGIITKQLQTTMRTEDNSVGIIFSLLLYGVVIGITKIGVDILRTRIKMNEERRKQGKPSLNSKLVLPIIMIVFFGGVSTISTFVILKVMYIILQEKFKKK
jgi:uncharacterized membrane protein YidH (DUF202 family)